jgi:hypothetical protein
MWLPARSPWKSHCLGFSTGHQARRTSNNFGESMTNRSLAPLALLHTNYHSLAIDIAYFQADSLGNAQPGSVADRQDSAVLDALHAAQKPQDLFWT